MTTSLNHFPEDPLLTSIAELFRLGQKNELKMQLWLMFQDSLKASPEHPPAGRLDLVNGILEMIDTSSGLA
ncbi:hypothetical protein [Dyadobacter bucti]|uniref:hypothetical protein n=1 Tax=Dyadobacter bucti TaxID=2572203 RepID=UPI001108DAD4|nr:hypothetical protein [Dyadobacter bucti]